MQRLWIKLKKKPTRTELSSRLLKLLVEQALDYGMMPILITTPTHRYSATSEVVSDLVNYTRDVARTYGIPYLNYLNNENEWATSDSYWGDLNHMNARGSDRFSGVLAADVKKLKL